MDKAPKALGRGREKEVERREGLEGGGLRHLLEGVEAGLHPPQEEHLAVLILVLILQDPRPAAFYLVHRLAVPALAQGRGRGVCGLAS